MSIRKSYYKDYLSLHKNRKNRRLHFIGQWVTLFVVSYMFYSGFYWLLPIIPFVSIHLLGQDIICMRRTNQQPFIIQ